MTLPKYNSNKEYPSTSFSMFTDKETSELFSSTTHQDATWRDNNNANQPITDSINECRTNSHVSDTPPHTYEEET
jgi:hypothetical protein